MITNTGKEIIAKYLMGTSPAYASYIALGCGAKPRPNITSVGTASSSSTIFTVSSTNGIWVGAKITKVSGTGVLSTIGDTIVTAILTSSTFSVNYAPATAFSGATVGIQTDPTTNVLDFEMFRVPISSRGYIKEDGLNKIILTAELPTEERYEISEVGVFSAGSNSNAGSYDSKTISAFADTENWKYNDGSSLSTPISITSSIIDGSNIITSTEDAIQTNSNNAGFLNTIRANRYERCRYLNNVLMLRGNTSHITSNGTNFVVASSPKILQLSGQTVDLTRNSTSDLLKIAFSLVAVDGNAATIPDTVRVLVEFVNSDGTQSAKMEAEATNQVYQLSSNRYVVIEKRLDELVYTPTFSWNTVSIIKIYVSTLNTFIINNKALSSNVATLTTSAAHGMSIGNRITVSGVETDFNGTFTVTAVTTDTFSYSKTYDGTVASAAVSPTGVLEVSRPGYFVALDAMRIDNVGTVNPLYGLTGYSIIQNTTAETIIKPPNTNNYIEFRFILDVT
jgi:hypothetical protein